MANTGISSLSGMTVRFDVNGDFYKGDHLFWNFNNQPSGGAFEWKNVRNLSQIQNLRLVDILFKVTLTKLRNV